MSRPNKTRPLLIHHHVPRKHLFTQLANDFTAPVTAVIAPPGYGKTTLVSSYVMSADNDAVWYCIDDDDADLAIFFHYFSQGVREATPHRRKPIPTYQPGDAMNVKVFARRYFNAVYQRFDRSFCIVFDDFHDCQSPLLHEVIKIAISELPETGKIFIVSRQALPSAFARLNLNQQIDYIREGDLKFTNEEVAKLALIHNIHSLPCEQYEQIQAMMAGWGAGLSLIFARMKHGDEQTILKIDTQQDLFNYFMSEVFCYLGDETQDLLYRTCFFPDVTVEYAVEVTGNAKAGEVLQGLHDRNYFTYHISSGEKVYRYHPLFKNFLISQAEKQLGLKNLNEIRNKSTALLKANHEIISAASILIDAGEWTQLAQYTIQYAREFVAENRTQTLAKWLRHIPKPIVNRSAWLLYWRAVCLLLAQPQTARPDFIAAYNFFKKAADITGQCLSLSGIIDSFIIERDTFVPLDEWIPQVEELQKKVNEQVQAQVKARLTISMFVALAHRAPQHPNFNVWLNRINDIASNALTSDLRIVKQTVLTLHYLWQGDFRRAEITCNLIEQQIKHHSDPGIQLRWYLIRSFFLWCTKGDSVKALNVAKQGLELARRYDQPTWTIELLTHGAAAALMAKKYNEADRLLRTASQSINETKRAHLSLYYTLHAIHKFYTGETQAAFCCAQESLRYAVVSGLPYYQAIAHFTQAQLYYLTDDIKNAGHHIAESKAIGSQMRSYFHLFRAHLFQAILDWSLGQQDNALKLLRYALELAKTYNLLPGLWVRENDLTQILAVAVQHNIEPDTVKQIMEKCGLTFTPPNGDAEYSPWLIRIHTLGRFEIYIQGELLKLPGRNRPKVFSLLKTLIALGGDHVYESTICDALWPDAEGDAAHRVFNTTIFRLRKLLRTPEALINREGKLSLNRDICWLDTWALSAGVDELTPMFSQAPLNFDQIKTRYEKIEIHYQGNFLPSEGEIPVISKHREHMRTKWIHTLYIMTTSATENNKPEDAGYFLKRIIQLSPLDEKAYQSLMKLHLSNGCLSEAITVYQVCKNVLKTELGIKPSIETERIFSKIQELGSH